MAFTLLSTRRRIFSLDAASRLAAAGRTPRSPIEFRSQVGEDMLLWDLLDSSLDGYYIEVGAFDGYDFSVSYAFDAIGWNGLLIEPIPERFEICRTRRPAARCVNAALSRKGSLGTTKFTYTKDKWGGMLSYIAGTATADHAALVKSQRCEEVTVEVPLTTMDDVLKDHDGPIDFAVIDVEGHEEALLDGFDLRRWRPRVLMIEDNTFGRNRKLLDLITRQGYTLVGLHEFNLVLIRSDDAATMNKARDLGMI